MEWVPRYIVAVAPAPSVGYAAWACGTLLVGM
jgi:hypothetical protein